MASGELRSRVAALIAELYAARGAGGFAEVRALAADLEDLLGHEQARERFGLPVLPLADAVANAAEALAEMGDFTGALAEVARARAISEDAAHLASRLHVEAVEGALHARFGDAALGAQILEGVVAVCRTHAVPGPQADALASCAEAYRRLGRHEDAVATVAASLYARSAPCGASPLTTLALAEAGQGDYEGAARTIRRALEAAERLGERAAEAWARLASADIARMRGEAPGAAAALDAAQEIAEELAMAALVGRCRALARALG